MSNHTFLIPAAAVGILLSNAPLTTNAQAPPTKDLLVAEGIGGDTKTNFIDAHVHVWTPDTARYPLAAGFKKENMKPASFRPEE